MTETIPFGDCDAALAAVSDDVLARLDGPTDKVRGLPNEAFTSDAFFELERKCLFPRSWMFAGRADEIPEPGDARPVEVAGHPLVLVRGKDKQIRVFQNVCLHRGARLVTQALRGTAALTCPYHAWSYKLDGTLSSRPHYHGPEKHDRANSGDNDRDCLFGVRSVTWHDWVFVNLDAKAPSFEDYIAPVAAHFEAWDETQFRFAYHDDFEFQCNWKLAVENFCDTYHVFKVHPELDRTYTNDDRSMASPGGVHLLITNTMVGPSRGLTLDPDGPRLPPIAGLADELMATQVTVNLFPNVTIVIAGGNLQFILFEPAAADRCVMRMWYYFVGDAARASEHETARDLVYNEWASLNAEDEDVCRRMQQGRRCEGYDGGRLAPYWDQGTASFHKMIAHAVRGDGPFAPVS